LHELSHVRRRDNLTAALHMMVTALFWFHPLIWWIGLRLVDERERACDEHVLRWGGGSETYAESILKVCEFCLESPLTCSAGVTGSDLKKRIEEIMRFHIGNPLKLSRIVLLMAVGITAVGGPIAIGVVKVAEGPVRSAIVTPPREPIVPAETRVIEGQGALETARIPREPQRAPQPPQAPAPQVSAATSESFEVVSIRPNTGATAGGARGGGPGARGGGPAGPSACGGGVQVNPGRFVATNVTLYRLITIAYGKHCRLFTEQDLLTGGPDWRQSAAFDIQATLPAGAPTTTLQQLVNGEAPQLQAMIRNMLADRFSLVLHGSSKEVPVYNLVIVRMGKIKLSEDQSPPAPLVPPTGAPAPRDPSAPPPRGSFGVGVDPPAGKVTIMASSIPIATMISFIQGGVGRMVVDKTEPKVLYDIPQVTVDVGPFEIAPGAVTVWPEIMNQLGLRMDPTRGPVEMLVIDRAEKPSEN
jgi:uncharacterized protein (TIGR03435 family)